MDLIRDAGLLGCKPSPVPMDPLKQLKQDSSNLMEDPSKYTRLIGRLLYLCITRPGITFAVHKLSQFVSKPCEEHWQAGEKVLRYLKGTPGHSLFYSSADNSTLSIFSDADRAAYPDTRRSMTEERAVGKRKEPLLLHLCEAESVSYLDEVASNTATRDVAKSVGLEALVSKIKL
ncbi:hypothetical protein SASPL_135523 [Salvia splendens]|uniref:Nodulin homeobox N-terminal domain-containing protein n=1 Tax=Salvia splendens TaxID=180675 RepID=A0A8X8X0C3_SALSN|nr:hypothetical protein SASPL_135523 [Salvia splendens]